MDTKELLSEIFKISIENRFPDIHFSTGEFPVIRNHSGNLKKIESIKQKTGTELDENGQEKDIFSEIPSKKLEKNDIIEIIKSISGEDGYNKFLNDFELDTSYNYQDKSRYRVNCYMDTNGYAVALRIIPNEIPTMEDLGLGDIVKDMCTKSKGLILMTGPTGSGKSTNIASMVNYLNQTFEKHIITIEDPVEFNIKSDKCLVNQREIGNSTKGFSQAIRASLREDPDIIVIGEMRDPETIKAAITLAETGHLVISTLHTNDTVQSVDRIIDVFPSGQQEQIRMQLAMSLIGIISQRLLPRDDKEGRIAAREIMIANDGVRNLIITGKTHQLYSLIEVSGKHGMILMDKYLIFLYKKGIISKDTLYSYGRDKEGIEMLINE